MNDANIGCLSQARRLLVRLDDRQYASPRGHHSAVGAQFRHLIEHYQCFLAGLAAGRIDYDARARDATVEASPKRAIEVVDELLLGFEAIGRADPETPLRVQTRCHADDPEERWAASSLARELQFLVSHSVHHFAVIRMLLEPDGLDFEADFGVAPSTVHARVAR